MEYNSNQVFHLLSHQSKVPVTDMSPAKLCTNDHSPLGLAAQSVFKPPSCPHTKTIPHQLFYKDAMETILVRNLSDVKVNASPTVPPLSTKLSTTPWHKVIKSIQLVMQAGVREHFHLHMSNRKRICQQTVNYKHRHSNTCKHLICAYILNVHFCCS